MFEKTIFTSFFLLILASFIKATTIGIKLFVMACAGLAGMYMVHLLAQDYNKYQSLSRPGRSVDEVFRRSIHEKVVPEEIDFAYIGNNTAKNILVSSRN